MILIINGVNLRVLAMAESKREGDECSMAHVILHDCAIVQDQR